MHMLVARPQGDERPAVLATHGRVVLGRPLRKRRSTSTNAVFRSANSGVASIVGVGVAENKALPCVTMNRGRACASHVGISAPDKSRVGAREWPPSG